MIHDPYFRKGSGPWGVLLIHGIAGSPGHFRDLLPVIPEEFSVYNILLDGHNGTVEDFSGTSMAKWKAQVRKTLEVLFSRHEKVVIVGHSMGTLFAIQAAIDRPDKIPALFLLNIPTRPWVRPSTLVTALQVAFGKTDTPRTAAMSSDTGIMLTRKLWKYLGWVPRMVELLKECRRVRKSLPRLAVPTRVYPSRTDELVSFRSCRDFRNPCMEVTVLEHSGHFVCGPADTALLRQHLLEMLESI